MQEISEASSGLGFYPRNDGWLLTTSGDDGVLKLWDVDTQQVVFTTGGPKGMLVDFALSPSGTLWLTRAPDAQSVHLWEFRPPSSRAARGGCRRRRWSTCAWRSSWIRAGRCSAPDSSWADEQSRATGPPS